MSVIFFDIGATLAEPHREPDGSLTLGPLPRVRAVLRALREVRKGIISNPGSQESAVARALAEAFPGDFTDAALVHWGVKDSRGIFDRAVVDAGGAAADDCVFVGENPQERGFAREAGMRTAAHPVFAVAATENRPVLRARIELRVGQDVGSLNAAMNETEAVPAEVVSERLVLALVTARGVEALATAGFTVDVRGSAEATATPGERDDGERDDAERRATEKFVSDLLARGEAVFEGEEPTPRTTHVIERADDGRLSVRRLRFSTDR
ncbi:HAD family hydrolase [Streptomyces sp. NPDC050263]|uniref:HAD family hydrolase n=1 Tax=Streptomyces sp. NPDC050263 TaxID=3155037 RepID=UPI003419E7EC